MNNNLGNTSIASIESNTVNSNNNLGNTVIAGIESNTANTVNSNNNLGSLGIASNTANPNNNLGNTGITGNESNSANTANSNNNLGNTGIASNESNSANRNDFAGAIAVRETITNSENPINSPNIVNSGNSPTLLNLVNSPNQDNFGVLPKTDTDNATSPDNFVLSGNTGNGANLGASLESLISSFEDTKLLNDLQGITISPDSSSQNSASSSSQNSTSSSSQNSTSSSSQNSTSSSSQNSASSSSQNSTSSSSQNSASSSSQNSASSSSQNSTSSSSQNSASSSSQNSASSSSQNSASSSSQTSGNDSFSSGGGVEGKEDILIEAFDNDDMEGTVWRIEQYRNQEFEEHLGVRANIENQSVAIANFRKELKRLSAETSQNYAVVYVVSGPEQLEIVVLTGAGDPARLSIPEGKREVILPLATKFRGELTNPRKLGTTSYLPIAQQLYQLIVAPMEGLLEEHNIDTLLFSMSPGLRSLPVAALHDGEQFLAEKYSTAMIPSFSLSDLSYRSVENASVLALGASKFTNLAPLPAVPVELATITSELGAGEFFLNEDFTLDNLQSQREAKPISIIHLATHAEFLPGVASNSYIQLWDEKLTLDQLPGLGWSEPMVDLLVISACRSALGDKEAELGLAGIAVQSGVRSALASLWYISDEGTLVLMSEFYRQLKQVPIKAEALRIAQIAMIRGQVRIDNGRIVSANTGKDIELPEQLTGLTNQDLSHPYYWSAFTMIGSPW